MQPSRVYYLVPRQLFPLSPDGRPTIVPYPLPMPSMSAPPINPASQQFYNHGAAPNLPPTLVDGRAFTHTGNFLQGTYVTRYPYYLGDQLRQPFSDLNSHCLGPSASEVAPRPPAPNTSNIRSSSTMSHMGAFGPYQTDGKRSMDAHYHRLGNSDS